MKNWCCDWGGLRRTGVFASLWWSRYVEANGVAARAAGGVGAPAAQMVVNFLAVLELARENLIELLQLEAFAPIYVRTARTAAVAEPV